MAALRSRDVPQPRLDWAMEFDSYEAVLTSQLAACLETGLPEPPKFQKEWTLYCLYFLLWDIWQLFWALLQVQVLSESTYQPDICFSSRAVLFRADYLRTIWAFQGCHRVCCLSYVRSLHLGMEVAEILGLLWRSVGQSELLNATRNLMIERPSPQIQSTLPK